MSDKTQKRTFFVSLRLKLLAGFTLIFSIVFAVAFYWFYQFATELAMNRITQDIVDTIQGAVRLIDGDQLQALYTEVQPDEDGYTTDPRYWEQVRVLWSVKQIEPRAAIYTYMRGVAPNELIFITSAGALNDPPTGAHYLESWTTENIGPNLAGFSDITLQDTPAGQKTDGCTFGTSGCTIVPYKDDFGSWVSAFVPIKNSKGEVVAAVGIDFKADYVDQVQQEILEKVYVAFAITYLSLFILVYLVSNLFTGPILTLTKAAQKIGEGDYQNSLAFLKGSDDSSTFPDEIGTLDRVFRGMVDKVYQREQVLRKQVEDLKIVIDQSKRDKQVSEIVDSEFFQDLRTKAQKMRDQPKKT